MKRISGSMVAALVLAIMLIAGNSAAEEAGWFPAETRLSDTVGSTHKVALGLKDWSCDQFHESQAHIRPKSVVVNAKIHCEGDKDNAGAAVVFEYTAGKTEPNGEAIEFSYGGHTKVYHATYATPVHQVYMPREEHDADMDEMNRKFEGLAPFEQRFSITVGLLTGPNMYDEEAGVGRGFHLALGVKPLDQSDQVAQLKLQAAVYYRHQSVYTNPNLDPTNMDSTEDLWFVGLGAFWSPAWGWGEFNLGGRVGAAMWQYPDTMLDQHGNLVVEEENQFSTTTLQLEPVLGINFFPHPNVILGLEGWGSYNVMAVNRYVGNDGDPNGHHFILSTAFLAGMRL